MLAGKAPLELVKISPVAISLDRAAAEKLDHFAAFGLRAGVPGENVGHQDCVCRLSVWSGLFALRDDFFPGHFFKG